RGLPTSTRIERVVRTLQSAHALNSVCGRNLKAPETTITPIGSGYWIARQVLSAHGLSVPRGMLVRQRTDLHAVTEQLTGPYVLKVGWLEHKSEHRGIALALTDRASLEAAYDDMVTRLGDRKSTRLNSSHVSISYAVF